jgi:hypothetical protein
MLIIFSFIISCRGPIRIKKGFNYKTLVFLAVILIILTCFAPISNPLSVNQNRKQFSIIEEDMILYVPMQSKYTYLIDKNGTIAHTWASNYYPGESVYLLDDGSILLTIKLSLQGGGAGGGVQKITYDGMLVWNYRYYTSNYLSHHDIEILPNGNILMIAWESKTRAEAIAAGRDPNKISGNGVRPDHIIEVKQTGPSTGEIVWEWHVWDHLIQDFDETKDNYGVIGEHPELIDINFGTSNSDWLHTNSIDYNEEFDQILLSVHNFNEIWVIDHSTTTEEAAGHTGGNSGKGGDILYRWGNPVAYHAGISNDRKFFGQHDARWIDTGCPGEGNILVFNNGGGRPGPDYTSIDEIVPPVDDSGNYSLEAGQAYDPEEQIWIYNTNFFAYYVGGAQRLPNGNTIICNGPAGKFIEVTPEKIIVWEYTNPYPNYLQNDVFKVNYYTPEEEPEPEIPDLDCEGSLRWLDITTGKNVHGSFIVQNIGGNTSLLNWIITEYPEWGTWTITPESGQNLTPEQGPYTIEVSVEAPDQIESEYGGLIRIENHDDPEDFDTIPVYLTTPRKRTVMINFFEHFKNYQYLQLILKLILKNVKDLI